MRKLSVISDEGLVPIDLIMDFSRKNNILFPYSYISLVSNHDYLYIKENNFNFINIYNENDERDISFLGYKEKADYEDIYTYSCINDECGYGKDIVAFGICANGDYVCFDYRKNKENPAIVVMYHDDFYEDDNGESKMVVNYVADNFDAFLDMLHEPSD